jgi:hypothetical protein
MLSEVIGEYFPHWGEITHIYEIDFEVEVEIEVEKFH